MAVLERPKALGPELALKTIDDVDQALHELAWCQHRETAIHAETKQAIDQLKKDREPLSELNIAALAETQAELFKTTLGERSATLEEAIKAWAKAHLTEHLEKGSKTLKLPHGEVAWKAQPLAVDLVEGVKEKAVLAAIDKKTGLLQLVTKFLAKIALGAFHLGELVRLTPELDKTAIKAAWDAKPKSRKTLQGLGIRVTGGDDHVVVAPTKHVTAKP